MKCPLVGELEQVLRDEIRLLGQGKLDEVSSLLRRKLEIINLLRRQPAKTLDRAELIKVWRNNRNLLRTLKSFVPDRVPSAASLRQGGWRG